MPALGEDLVEAIDTTVAKCDVLIAVIGANWLTSKDHHGNPRLDNPEDFVRMETPTALKRKIRVIPLSPAAAGRITPARRRTRSMGDRLVLASVPECLAFSRKSSG